MARIAAAGALALAVALVVWLLLFRGPSGTEYTFLFQTAGQLVVDDDVQVGGRRVGSVRAIELTDDNKAAIKVVVEEPFAPLRDGTQAVVRLTSLSGIANRYIALTPAPGDARELDDGATITADSTTDVVDLDQIFNTLDERTRGDLADVIKGFATQYQGKGEEAGESTKYFNPLLSSSRRLVQEVTEDEEALTEFLVNSSRAVTTIAERRNELADLVGNANQTAAAIGQENAALARALGLLPTTLRRANTTFVNLRATLDDLDVLVAESKPATKDLAPFLRELRPLVAAARPTIRDLRLAVRRPGSDNDLVEATRKMPQLQRAATPAFRSGRQALVRAQPVLEFARPYTPDFVGWLRDFGQGAANYDANGHYARIQPIFNAFQFADNPAGGLLTPVPPANRMDGVETGVIRRCPGAATQRPADGSAPFTDGGDVDCDPSLVLPGP
ncbi:MAG TPA: MlaD family protein [Solirubrobacteraceae bacterium]|nr:MlaD family protein [Solirubrobacteraceae bacterium]